MESSGQMPTPQSQWLEHMERATAYTGWVFEAMAPFIRGAVLEIGCGQGTYTPMLSRCASHVTALDLEPAFVEQALRATSHLANVDIRQGDVNQEHFDQVFDTIVMIDVLEHLEDSDRMLRTLGGALRPGGRLIVKVPAFRWLHGAVDDAVGHHRRYDRRSLAEEFRRASLEPEELWYFNAAAIPAWWLNGVVLRRATPPAGQLALLDRMVPVLRAVDRVARPFLGLSLFGVARRPEPRN